MSEPDGKAPSETEVNFLLDQVQRLSNLLSRYQKGTDSPSLEEHLQDPVVRGEETSWLLEKRSILAPLIMEYDRIIDDLKRQNIFYQAELENLVQRIQDLTDENKRLYDELDKALRAQINNNNNNNAINTTINSEDGGNSEETVSSELILNLKQQRAVLMQERDSYLDKWQASQQELLRIQKSAQEQSSQILDLNTRHLAMHEQLNVLKHSNVELKNYKDTLEMESERSNGFLRRKAQLLDGMQTELNEAKSQFNLMKMKNIQMEKLHEQTNQRIRLLENEKDVHLQGDLESEQEKTRMKSHIQERELALSEQRKDILALQEGKVELERSLMATSRKLKALVSREEEAVRHVKESIDMVETAMLEKNQALMRAQQSDSEVSRLNETLSQLVEEAGNKTKRAVDNVRLECNQSITKMAREIRSLEEELQGKAMELEKVSRVKLTSEKEVERMKRDSLSQNLEAIQQLQQRLSNVELERETAILKMEGIYSDFLQASEQLEQERKQVKTERHNARQRQETLRIQIETQKQDQLKLCRQVEELKASLKEAHLDVETCERKSTLKIQSLTNQFKSKEADLQANFDGVQSSHRAATSELRNLLSSHQRLGTKWREETKVMTEKFENTTRKLKEESSKLKRSNEEMKNEIAQGKFGHQALNAKLKNLESQRDNQQDRIDELEDRNDQYSQQLTKYMTKERQWEQEQKILNTHLTRLQIQSSRSNLKSKGSRIMTAPSDKLKPSTSEYMSSATLPPPVFSSTSSIPRATQSPNVLSEPFLHFESSNDEDSILSRQSGNNCS